MVKHTVTQDENQNFRPTLLFEHTTTSQALEEKVFKELLAELAKTDDVTGGPLNRLALATSNDPDGITRTAIFVETIPVV